MLLHITSNKTYPWFQRSTYESCCKNFLPSLFSSSPRLAPLKPHNYNICLHGCAFTVWHAAGPSLFNQLPAGVCVCLWAASLSLCARTDKQYLRDKPFTTLYSAPWGLLRLKPAAHWSWCYWAQHPRVGTVIFPFVVVVVFMIEVASWLHFCSSKLLCVYFADQLTLILSQ